MRILNFGSLNIDHVYRLERFVKPGETMESLEYNVFPGGKGLNQSIALARITREVFHAGLIGEDGLWLKDLLKENGVKTELLEVVEGSSGHALIQVDGAGENSIIIHGGANRMVTADYIKRVVAGFQAGDYLLLQNEINKIPEIIEAGFRAGMKIVLNPAPMDEGLRSYPLDLVSLFILNWIEGQELSSETDPAKIVETLLKRFPGSEVVLTQGEKGVLYGKAGEENIWVPAQKVKAVDTTGAGDTFTGFFVGSLSAGHNVRESLQTAVRAAAFSVTREGAASSIPQMVEL